MSCHWCTRKRRGGRAERERERGREGGREGGEGGLNERGREGGREGGEGRREGEREGYTPLTHLQQGSEQLGQIHNIHPSMEKEGGEEGRE